MNLIGNPRECDSRFCGERWRCAILDFASGEGLEQPVASADHACGNAPSQWLYVQYLKLD